MNTKHHSETIDSCAIFKELIQQKWSSNCPRLDIMKGGEILTFNDGININVLYNNKHQFMNCFNTLTQSDVLKLFGFPTEQFSEDNTLAYCIYVTPFYKKTVGLDLLTFIFGDKYLVNIVQGRVTVLNTDSIYRPTIPCKPRISDLNKTESKPKIDSCEVLINLIQKYWSSFPPQKSWFSDTLRIYNDNLNIGCMFQNYPAFRKCFKKMTKDDVKRIFGAPTPEYSDSTHYEYCLYLSPILGGRNYKRKALVFIFKDRYIEEISGYDVNASE